MELFNIKLFVNIKFKMKTNPHSSRYAVDISKHQVSTIPTNADLSPKNKYYETLSNISTSRSRILNSNFKKTLEATSSNHYDSMNITWSNNNQSSHELQFVSNQIQNTKLNSD